MSTPRILVADKIAAEGVAVFRAAGFDVDVRTGMSADELAAAIGAYDGMVVRSASQASGDAFWAGATRLKVIGRAGAGVDNIDVPAATAHGTLVMNTPGGNNNAVAELVLGMMLAMARHLIAADTTMKAGRWEKAALMGEEIEGKTLGIIGLGAIGQIVARKAGALGMTIIAYDPITTAEAAAAVGATLHDLDTVFANSDVITIHVPLLAQTRGVIGAEALAKTRKGARLIDCARGGIIDEPALLAALESGQIGCAALDVFATEPVPAYDALVAHPKVLATPHIGASTRQAQDKVGVQIAEQMVAYLQSGTIQFAVNKLA